MRSRAGEITALREIIREGLEDKYRAVRDEVFCSPSYFLDEAIFGYHDFNDFIWQTMIDCGDITRDFPYNYLNWDQIELEWSWDYAEVDDPDSDGVIIIRR